MDVRQIRNLSDEALEDAILDKREELFNLRFQDAAGQVEDTNLLKYARRELAQLITIQHERKLAARLVQEGEK